MRHYRYTFWILIALLIAGCDAPQTDQSSEDRSVEAFKDLKSEKVDQQYKVYKAPDSKKFPKASLKMAQPSVKQVSEGEVKFEFEVSGFELGQQTDDAGQRGIANSKNGQHIHYIQNNDPYSAHYESSFTKELEVGHHVILSFLSRSYHESVKNGRSHVVTMLTVGNPTDEMTFDPDGQHLFYSRPKGTYSGADTEKLMIDFFLMNTEISAEGNKVRATINGEPHMITEWAPHYIEGLEKGEVTIKLELLDAKLNPIPGPYNQVERTVTLE